MSSGGVGLVVDTNVWLDALLFDDPQVGWFHSKSRIFSCESQRTELFLVLSRPTLARLNKTLDPMMAVFDERVSLQENPPAVCPLICKDKDDQKFLDLAWQNPPCILLTKDKKLLELNRKAKRLALTGELARLQIVSPLTGQLAAL